MFAAPKSGRCSGFWLLSFLQAGERESRGINYLTINKRKRTRGGLRVFINVWKGSGDYTSSTRSLHNDGVTANLHIYKLDTSHVHNQDFDSDTLTGNGGLDWIWIDDGLHHQSHVAGGR
jgi:hypothetical protein